VIDFGQVPAGKAVVSVSSHYSHPFFLPHDRARVGLSWALPHAFASRAIPPHTGMRPGRLLTEPGESLHGVTPFRFVRLTLPLGPHCLPGHHGGCTGGHRWTCPPRWTMPLRARPATSRGSDAANDSSGVRSSPDHRQPARGVPDVEVAGYPRHIPASTALITNRNHGDVAFPPCIMRGRDHTDHRTNQL
jgi:hypothetical protein